MCVCLQVLFLLGAEKQTPIIINSPLQQEYIMQSSQQGGDTETIITLD